MTLAPIAPEHNFHWDGKYFHLTYARFIPKTEVLEMVLHATATQLAGWSIVWEIGASGYEHTHVALIFQARLNMRGARKFDIYMDDNDNTGLPVPIHPHVQPKVHVSEMEQLVCVYHFGRKWDPEQGRLVYTAPVEHWHELPAGFQWSRAIIDECIEAPTLSEACVAANVRPRSVSDVKLLRTEAAQAPKRFKHAFAPSSFKQLVAPGWTCLWLYGPSGLGKTKWGLAQLKNPLIVKPFDSVGGLELVKAKFDPAVHDGIVFDEADLRFMSRSQAIAICDTEEDACMNVRYGHFELGADVRRIFISNPPPDTLWPTDPAGAIKRRVHVLHVTERTFVSPPVQAQPAQPAQAACV